MCCRFDMEGEEVYSVKWYKAGHEFYRYIPGDRYLYLTRGFINSRGPFKKCWDPFTAPFSSLGLLSSGLFLLFCPCVTRACPPGTSEWPHSACPVSPWTSLTRTLAGSLSGTSTWAVQADTGGKMPEPDGKTNNLLSSFVLYTRDRRLRRQTALVQDTHYMWPYMTNSQYIYRMLTVCDQIWLIHHVGAFEPQCVFIC